MRGAQNMGAYGKVGAASAVPADRTRTVAVRAGGKIHFAPDQSLRRRLEILAVSGDEEQIERELRSASPEAIEGLGELYRSRSAAAALKAAEAALT